MGVIGGTAVRGRLVEDAVAWAALVPPDCYPAHAFAKRALRAATMVAIGSAARLDRDLVIAPYVRSFEPPRTPSLPRAEV